MRHTWPSLRPAWRARLLRAAVGFGIAIAVLSGLGLNPTIALLAGLLVAALGLGYAMDTPTGGAERSWVAGDLAGAAWWRGSEHATTSLAEHLARIEASPGTTDELTRLLHARLRAVLEAWVWRTQHVDLRRNAGWARSLLPPDLADFYTADPDPQALRSDRLDHLLTRIENL